jgi:thiosulfate dehydrogenase
MGKLRWSALFYAFALILAVAACGGDDDADDTTTTTAAPTTTTTATTVAPPSGPTGDVLTGGLLYDKWWTVAGVDEPTTDQALWATQSDNTRSGKDTWRCKECHGWDYKGADGAYGGGSHFTGFAGVYGAQGQSAADLTAVMTTGDHDFSSSLSEQNIADLVVFVQAGLADYGQFIDADKGIIGGDVANGESLYVATCTACHGADGTTLNFGDDDDPEFVATIAQDNPWEFFHKVRYGQPGSNPPMPASEAAGWSLEDVRDIAAYSQTLATEVGDADATALGGLLYDKWWKVVGADEPTTDNPVFARQTSNERSGGDTWRCKECHGWDYQGVDGAYSSGSHMTGFPGIFGAKDKSAEDIIAQISGQVDAEHDFSGLLSDIEIAALAAFVRDGLLDMSVLIDLETKAPIGGDIAAGEALFTSNCTACHGADGTALNFGDDEEPEYVGALSAGNPWEVAHKILFGHPGSNPAMPAQFTNGWGDQEIVDILTYLQTLP